MKTLTLILYSVPPVIGKVTAKNDTFLWMEFPFKLVIRLEIDEMHYNFPKFRIQLFCNAVSCKLDHSTNTNHGIDAESPMKKILAQTSSPFDFFGSPFSGIAVDSFFVIST